MDLSRIVKNNDLQLQAKYRNFLVNNPRLRYLFLELTDKCNLSCIHCGSHCDISNSTYLNTELLFTTLKTVSEDFDVSSVMICLTGGEPLLHPDFERIVTYINELGFSWGMTTNGSLINETIAIKLKKLKMGSISISLDGLRDTHNWFRGAEYNNYQKVIDAIYYLKNNDFSVQVTTVVHKRNIDELESMYSLLIENRVDSWRVVNIEPIGRALQHKELLLNNSEILFLLNFIKEKRLNFGITSMDVCYGCSHYLSIEFERNVRDNCFICGSGILVASILCNGDIYSCLDIERRQELIQGNINYDRFSKVWHEKFKEFREDRSEKCETCKKCNERDYCLGDSAHTWDFDTNTPRFCIKNIL